MLFSYFDKAPRGVQHVMDVDVCHVVATPSATFLDLCTYFAHGSTTGCLLSFSPLEITAPEDYRYTRLTP